MKRLKLKIEIVIQFPNRTRKLSVYYCCTTWSISTPNLSHIYCVLVFRFLSYSFFNALITNLLSQSRTPALKIPNFTSIKFLRSKTKCHMPNLNRCQGENPRRKKEYCTLYFLITFIICTQLFYYTYIF